MGVLKFCRIRLLILDRLPLIGCLRELQSLAKKEEIAFNADLHSELVRLSYKDFERLARPTAAKFSLRPQVNGIPETPAATATGHTDAWALASIHCRIRRKCPPFQ
jgi:hypothetical protein